MGLLFLTLVFFVLSYSMFSARFDMILVSHESFQAKIEVQVYTHILQGCFTGIGNGMVAVK